MTSETPDDLWLKKTSRRSKPPSTQKDTDVLSNPYDSDPELQGPGSYVALGLILMNYKPRNLEGV